MGYLNPIYVTQSYYVHIPVIFSLIKFMYPSKCCLEALLNHWHAGPHCTEIYIDIIMWHLLASRKVYKERRKRYKAILDLNWVFAVGESTDLYLLVFACLTVYWYLLVI